MTVRSSRPRDPGSGRRFRRLLHAALGVAVLSSFLAPARAQSLPRRPDPPAKVWIVIENHHAEAACASLEAIDDELNRFGKFLERSKTGGKSLAKSLLSFGAKFAYARGAAEQGVYTLGRTFGTPSSGPPPDAFKEFVVDQFRTHIISDEELRQTVDSIIRGYSGELLGLESKMLVDARIDLDNSALLAKEPFAPLTRADLWFREVGPELDAIAQTAGADVWVDILTNQVGNQAGKLAAGQFVNPETSPLTHTLLSFGFSMVAERLIEGAMHQGGYRPNDRIAEAVNHSLGRLGFSLAMGDDKHYEDYVVLMRCRFDHGDPAVRRACEEATQAMERSPSCGLRARLVGLHMRRFAASKLALYRMTFGEKATPPRLCDDHPTVRRPSAEILRLAQNCTRKYGAR